MKDQSPIITELTTENVQNIIMACFFKDEELPEIPEAIQGNQNATMDFLTKKGVNFVMAHGVMLHTMFNKVRLDHYAKEIKELLRQLPESFDAHGESGGHSFLQACCDRHGNQWGEHHDVDSLLTMGIAIGVVEFLVPREHWKILPGGMPYLAIDYTKF